MTQRPKCGGVKPAKSRWPKSVDCQVELHKGRLHSGKWEWEIRARLLNAHDYRHKESCISSENAIAWPEASAALCLTLGHVNNTIFRKFKSFNFCYLFGFGLKIRSKWLKIRKIWFLEKCFLDLPQCACLLLLLILHFLGEIDCLDLHIVWCVPSCRIVPTFWERNGSSTIKSEKWVCVSCE